MEALYRDFSPKGVQFYYIYKSLAHPELQGYINPFTLEERFMHVQEAKRTLGTRIPWIVDQMDNRIRHALGSRSNPEFLVDPSGEVVYKMGWSNPQRLRRQLEERVGPVENPTRLEDLNLPTAPPPMSAASGVVPRLDRPVTGHHYMLPVRRTPEWSDEGRPYYAKLRAEADRTLLKEGRGRLYIGFFMDPLYGVHWNNLSAPIRVSIQAAEGMTVTPSQLVGPKVEAESDIDPREFMVDIETTRMDQPLRLTANYFACNDQEGWCIPMTQRYQIYLERDQDGGNHPARSSHGDPEVDQH